MNVEDTVVEKPKEPAPQKPSRPPAHKPKPDSCHDAFPDLRRPNYFFGQMLGPREFQGEQAYFRNKLQLHNRCLHGYGVVCGLVLTPKPSREDCEPNQIDPYELRKLERLAEQYKAAVEAGNEEAAERLKEVLRQIEELKQQQECEEPTEPSKILVECGLAYDCHGNELTLRQTRELDVWHLLSSADQKKYDDAIRSTRAIPPIYISICSCEQPVEPTRPMRPADCGFTKDCAHGWTRESVRFEAGLDAPKDDDRCEVCCEACCTDSTGPCGDACTSCGCLVLARIDDFEPGKPIGTSQIHNEVRRPITTYVPTSVVGVSWQHGATYSLSDTDQILGNYQDTDKGLVIEFSRPVLAETITEGVVDVWVVEGPRGSAAQIKHLEGEFVNKPDSGPITRLVYRRTADDAPDPGDRVLVQVRTTFILDRCCRAVDGENVGGRVPLLPEFAARSEWEKDPRPPQPCRYPPPGFPAPWQSGNGTPAGDYLSWFFVEKTNRRDRQEKGY